MQEHIESLTDKEDIVRGNKGSLFLVSILVVFLAFVDPRGWYEPVGTRGGEGDGDEVGRDGRTGRAARAACSDLCSATEGYSGSTVNHVVEAVSSSSPGYPPKPRGETSGMLITFQTRYTTLT